MPDLKKRENSKFISIIQRHEFHSEPTFIKGKDIKEKFGRPDLKLSPFFSMEGYM